jgi:hypothetical protein
MLKEEPVGLVAERHATWLLEDLLSFRKQAGAVTSRPTAELFLLQQLKKQWKVLPKSNVTTRNTQKQRGKLLSNFLTQKKSAKTC